MQFILTCVYSIHLCLLSSLFVWYGCKCIICLGIIKKQKSHKTTQDEYQLKFIPSCEVPSRKQYQCRILWRFPVRMVPNFKGLSPGTMRQPDIISSLHQRSS